MPEVCSRGAILHGFGTGRCGEAIQGKGVRDGDERYHRSC
jgi:hypothetical protein